MTVDEITDADRAAVRLRLEARSHASTCQSLVAEIKRLPRPRGLMLVRAADALEKAERLLRRIAV